MSLSLPVRHFNAQIIIFFKTHGSMYLMTQYNISMFHIVACLSWRNSVRSWKSSSKKSLDFCRTLRQMKLGSKEGTLSCAELGSHVLHLYSYQNKWIECQWRIQKGEWPDSYEMPCFCQLNKRAKAWSGWEAFIDCLNRHNTHLDELGLILYMTEVFNNTLFMY